MKNKSFFILSILLLFSPITLGEFFDEQVHHRITLEKDEFLSVYNVKGQIVIEPWNENYVDVMATKRGSIFKHKTMC